MSDATPMIAQLLADEGDTYIPDDHGRGPCKYGITLATLKEYIPLATAATIQGLTADAATHFYQNWFNRYRIGLITDQELACKVFNLGFNMGPGTAIKLLQEAVGVEQDGVLGPKTAMVVNKTHCEEALESFQHLCERHYRAIVAAHPEWAGNLKGWLKRVWEE